MHQALYRKWRPKTFDEVCGQEHITDILKYETGAGKTSHAYLFCGSRGTGKTTCAKILARAVNCENPKNGNPCGECYACRSILDGSSTDVLEMDAASNNKVDDIRTILDEVIYTPGMLRYRVYIIDEVHMLTTSAFNALLKTLEEPPEHVIFILATTEMQKLPATIISRCQRFDFRRIATSVLVDRLKYIAGEENIVLDPEAALILARLAQGGMRDAISLFELCAAGGRAVTPEAVSDTVGFRGRGPMSRCVRAVLARDYNSLFDAIAKTDASASDIGVFWQELISYYRDMLVFRTAGAEAAARYLDLTDSETAMLSEDASKFSRETLSYHCRLLDDAYTSMQRPGVSRRTVAELTFVRLCDEKLNTSNDALLARISALETRAASGAVFTSEAAPAAKAPEAPAKPAEEKAAPAKAPVRDDPSPSVQPTPAPASSGTGSGRRRLRPVKGWAEIIEEFGKTNQGSATMLSTEKAYTDDSGKILICYSKEITKIMVSGAEKMSSLCGACSLVLGHAVTPQDIVFEKVAPGNHAPSDADVLAGELGELADGK